MKIIAQKSAKDSPEVNDFENAMTNTIRIARLKLLFIAAKVVTDSNRYKVKYSIHDTRTSPMMKFLKFIDMARGRPKPWEKDTNWTQRFSIQCT
jgi:hypothetical protein